MALDEIARFTHTVPGNILQAVVKTFNSDGRANDARMDLHLTIRSVPALAMRASSKNRCSSWKIAKSIGCVSKTCLDGGCRKMLVARQETCEMNHLNLERIEIVTPHLLAVFRSQYM